MSKRHHVNKSTRCVAAAMAVLLLMPYVPLQDIGEGGPDHHCIQCTENYCTRDQCFCGHDHLHDEAAAVAATTASSGSAPHTAHHHGAEAQATAAKSGSAAHAPHHHGAEAQAVSAPTAKQRPVAFRPCGSDRPDGVPVFRVDHYLVGTPLVADASVDDRRRILRLMSSAHAQTMGDDVFHPPARQV